MKEGTYAHMIRIPGGIPAEHREHMLERSERQAFEQLTKTLQEQIGLDQFATVKLTRHESQVPSPFAPPGEYDTEIRYRLELNAVQTRHVTYQTFDPIPLRTPKPKPNVLRRFGNWLKQEYANANKQAKEIMG